METSAMSIVRRCLRPGSAWLTALLILTAMVCASMGVAHAAETITYYYTSPQGTVLTKADASGNILSNADYRPYGTQAMGTPEQGPGYTGHVNDVDSGLVYMQARYYAPDVGRFLSSDWDEPRAGNTASFNRFAYAANNPVVNQDANGRCVDGVTCDSMARSFALHPEATRPLAPIAIAGAAIMAAPTLVLAAAAALPEAGPVASLGSEEASNVAVAAARQAAIDAQSAGATRGASSAVVTESGEIFTGMSTNAGGPGMATNSLVQEALDAVPEAVRPVFHGCCGEINAYSNLLNAGAKIEGSTAATVRTAGSGALNVMEACASCKIVSEYLRVMTVSP
ncbi:RHS repeat-associated core domain-containing protein [Luteibacter sp. PvP120]